MTEPTEDEPYPGEIYMDAMHFVWANAAFKSPMNAKLSTTQDTSMICSSHSLALWQLSQRLVPFKKDSSPTSTCDGLLSSKALIADQLKKETQKTRKSIFLNQDTHR